MTNHILFSLDIGSSKVVAIAGSIAHEGIDIHGFSSYYFNSNFKSSECFAIRNGVICDLETISQKVAQVLNEARIQADCTLGSVIINITGVNVKSIYSSQSLELQGQPIGESHISELINKARQINLPPNLEVINYEVQEYAIDEEHYTVNPLNLMALKLQSNINLFVANQLQIANLKKVINLSGGFDVARIIPSGILSSYAVLNEEEKALGCCLVDIGAGNTDIVVYENGYIRHLCSIPLGGDDITSDIAAVLKISKSLAEDIKLNYGQLNLNSPIMGDNIRIVDHRGVTTNISRSQLNSIISERLKDIFKLIKSFLIKEKLYGIINSGLVLTGGVANISGIENLAQDYFNMPSKIGVPNFEGAFCDIVTNPRFSTSLGALYFARKYMLSSDNLDNDEKNNFFYMGSLINKLKKVFGSNK